MQTCKKWIGLLALSLGFLGSCQTSMEQEGEKLMTKSFRTQDYLKPSTPLIPARKDIWMDLYLNQVKFSSKRVVKVWDLNHDGRGDMVEVIGDDDTTSEHYFDFDFDGKIDASEGN